MRDNRRRDCAIRATLTQAYPPPTGRCARHWQTLAALMSGIVGSKSPQLVWLNKSTVSTPLKLLRLDVYWTAR